LLNVVVPVAAFVCVRAPAILTVLLKVSAALFVIVKLFNEILSPIACEITIFPAKELRVRFSAPDVVPLIVPLIVSVPVPEVKTGEAAEEMTKLPPIVKSVSVVVILFANVAAPVVLNPLGAVIAPVAPFVKMPLLVTAIAPVAAKLLFTA
jgi:hypothetical protein